MSDLRACTDPFPFTWHLTLKEVADHDALDRELQLTGMLRDGKAARYASLHGRRYWPPAMPGTPDEAA